MMRWNYSMKMGCLAFLLWTDLVSCGGPKAQVASPPTAGEPVGDVLRMRNLAGRSTTGQVVGSLPLAFSVTDDGRTSAEIDLEVPPGTGGTQPQATLAYDSRSPSGKLGMGWQLSGASAITRLGANIEQDGFRGGVTFSSSDRFGIDGMRMICVNGTDGADRSQYRTERDSFQIVTASGTCGSGPCSFTTLTNEGRTRVYGGTTDSRILAGAGPTVLTWALSSDTDLHGNSVRYQYTQIPYGGAQNLNDYYLQNVTYTVNDAAPIPKTRTVTFAYEARPDVETRYVGGIAIGTAARLSHVTSAVGGQTVSDYRITYDSSPDPTTGRSRVASLARCDGTDGSALCLPATTATWQSEVGASVDQGQVLQGASPAAQFLYPAWDPAQNPRFLADVNGDGRADLVGFRLGVQVSLSSGSGFAAQTQWNADFGLGWTDQTPRMIGDLNGDGMADVVGFGFKGLLVGISTGSSFDEKRWSGQGDTFWTAGWSTSQNPRMLADVNGDGLDDIIGFRDKTYVGLSTGTGFAAPTSWNDSAFTGPSWQTALGAIRLLADVNGDGRADLIGFSQAGVIVGISTGGQGNQFDTSLWPQNQTGFPYFGVNVGGWMPGVNPRMMADVNGDGLADIVGFKNGVQVALSTGTGFLPPQTWNTNFSQESSPPWTQSTTRYVVDINGDGKADVVGFNTSGALVALSDGRSALTTTSWNSSALSSYSGTQANYPILIGDANGDGLPDAIALGAKINTPQRQVTSGAPAGPFPDLMTGLTSGWGGMNLVTYRPMTDPSIYSRGTPVGQGQDAVVYQDAPAAFAYSLYAGSFPVRSIQSGNSYLVASYEQKNAPAVSSTYDNRFSYFYTGAKLDVLAVRDLGMQTMATNRLANGTVTTVTYNQAFPLTRTHAVTTTTCGPKAVQFDPRCTSGKLLTQTATGYTAQQTATGVTGTKPVIAFPAMASERQDYYDYGAYNYSIGQQHTFDSWGNEQTTSYLGYVDPKGKKRAPPAPVARKKAAAKEAAADDAYLVCSSYSDYQPSDPRYRAFLISRKVTTASRCSPGFTNGTDLELSSNTYSTDGKMNLLSQQKWDNQSSTNLTTSYAYDAYGNPTQVTPPSQPAMTVTYDTDYQAFPTLQTSPSLTSSSGTYDLRNQLYYEPRFGTLSTKIDPNGLVTINCVDSFGRLALVQTTAPTGGPTDTNCLPSGAVGATAKVLTIKTQQWGNDGETYRSQQSLQSWPTGAARVWQTSYSYEDPLNRVYKKVTDSAGPTGESVLCYQRNDVGAVTATSTPAFLARNFDCQAGAASLLWQQTSYDAYDREIRISTPAGPDGKTPSITTYAYAGSSTVTMTEGAGQPGAFTRVLSHLVRSNKQLLSGLVVPSDSNATSSYRYDPLGRLLTAQDPAGVTTTVGYDSISRRISLTSPDYGAITWDYAGKDQVHTMTTPRGSAIYAYDSVGRLTQVTSGERTINYTYDDSSVPNSKQLMTSAVVSQGGSQVTTRYLAYDPYGNVTSQALTVPTRQQPYVTGKSFDPQGRMTQEVLPDGQGTIGYAFTSANLTQITFNGQPVANLTDYSALGLKGKVTFTRPNTIETYGYDPTGDLLSLSVTSPAGKLLDLGWTWDDLTQVQKVADRLKAGGTDLSETFGYTNLRLTSASGPYGSPSFGYDTSGNLTSIGATTFTYSGHRVMTGKAGGSTVFSATYDPAGGMATKTTPQAALTYTYDLDSQLTRVDQQGSGTPVMTFLTDHTGRRVVATSAQQTVTYVDTSYKVVQPTSGAASTVASFLDNGAPIASVVQGAQPGWVFLHRNHLGSTVLATVANGTVGTYITYEPYGKVSSINPSFAEQVDRKFTGRELDAATGLYYYTTRYYDPTIGRFITPDTGMGDQLDRPDAQNSYAYALNNPVKYIDPDGTQPWVFWANVFRFSAPRWTTFLRPTFAVTRYSRLFSVLDSRLGTTSLQQLFSPGFRTAISFGDNLPTTILNSASYRSPFSLVRWYSTSLARGSSQGTSVIDVFNGRADAKLAETIFRNGIKWDLIPSTSRFGKAFYVAEDVATARAELAAHGQDLNAYVKLRLDLSRTKMLDLTDPDVASQWGSRFPGWDSTTVGDYTQSQALAQAARQGGFDGIRYASIRNPGGTATAVFEPQATAANSGEATAGNLARLATTAADSSVAAEGATATGATAATDTAVTLGATASATAGETGVEGLAIVGLVFL